MGTEYRLNGKKGILLLSLNFTLEFFINLNKILYLYRV